MARQTLLALVLAASCSRPYARLAPGVGLPGSVAVVGRVLEPEDDDPTVPWTSISEDEVERGRYEWRTDSGESGNVRANEEGWVRIRPRGLPPGRHRIHLRDGTKRRLGSTTALVLDPAGAPRVVRSDVDLTYLDTRFHGAGELVRLLKTPASGHRPLAGMPEVYRGLRVSALTFLSGSPEFFRAHLQARLSIDEIRFDALRLKPMGDVAWTELLAGRPDRIVNALKEQVGYKLAALLEDRLALPARATEVLLGDDSEMDPFAYRLYRDAAAGRMTVEALRRELEGLGVADDLVRTCVRQVPRVRNYLGTHETVRAIFIRRTDRPNAQHPSGHLAAQGIRFHRGSKDLAEALAELGWLRREAVTAVAAAEG